MVEIEGKRYFTTAELSYELRKSQELLRNWCRRGLVTARKIGREYFIPEEEAEALKRFLKHNTILRKNWKAGWSINVKEGGSKDEADYR